MVKYAGNKFGPAVRICPSGTVASHCPGTSSSALPVQLHDERRAQLPDGPDRRLRPVGRPGRPGIHDPVAHRPENAIAGLLATAEQLPNAGDHGNVAFFDGHVARGTREQARAAALQRRDAAR